MFEETIEARTSVPNFNKNFPRICGAARIESENDTNYVIDI